MAGFASGSCTLAMGESGAPTQAHETEGRAKAARACGPELEALYMLCALLCMLHARIIMTERPFYIIRVHVHVHVHAHVS